MTGRGGVDMVEPTPALNCYVDELTPFGLVLVGELFGYPYFWC